MRPGAARREDSALGPAQTSFDKMTVFASITEDRTAKKNTKNKINHPSFHTQETTDNSLKNSRCLSSKVTDARLALVRCGREQARHSVCPHGANQPAGGRSELPKSPAELRGGSGLPGRRQGAGVTYQGLTKAGDREATF